MKTKSLLWLFLLAVTFTWSQKIKNINQQQFIQEKESWKLIEEQTGQKFELSDEITIQFKKTPSKKEIQELEKKHQIKLMRSNKLGFYDFKVQKKSNLLSAFESIDKNIKAEQIYVNTIGKYILNPNDPQFGMQWGLEQISDADIDMSNAWDLSTGNSNVVVAILDSGTDWTHEDIGLGTDGYQNVLLNSGEDAWANPNNPNTGNGIDDDGNGFIDDWKGWDFGNGNNDSRGAISHGTQVAGIVGAKTNNNKGVSGIAGGNNNVGAKMMLLGVGDFAPNGAILDDAILYAVNNGAKVIQLSLTVASSPAINMALQTAYNNGVFIVCASGNGGNVAVSYPASNTNVFSVGATTNTDTRANFSQTGINLDIAAPGVGIRSTTIGNNYGVGDGTSFAAPAVSATAALMLSVDPSLTNEAIEDILKCTAEKVGGYNYNWNASMPGHSQELGYGRLNAHQALLATDTADIYIRDTVADDGTEPSSGTMYQSPDIWVRHNDDGGLAHQNPEYKLFSPNWVYIRVNRKNCSNVDDANLKLYFSKASTGLSWPLHWNNYYEMVGLNNVLHGDFIGDVSVPTSASGEVIVKIPWFPPNPSDFINDVHHFCLLARIESLQDPIGIETTSIWNNTKNNNNIAWKNLSVYDINAFNNIAPSVFIRNIDKKARAINLTFNVTENKTGVPFEKFGGFYIIPDKKLNELLAKSKMKGIKRIDRNVYQIYTPKAEIYNIPAEPFQTFSLQLLVKPNQDIKKGRFLMYDIVQTDEKNRPTGGELYQIGNFGGKRKPQTELPNTDKEIIKFKTYPNPTKGHFIVELDRIYTNVDVVIKSITGEVVYTGYSPKTNQLKVKLKASKGLYFIQINTKEGKTKSVKLIKN